MSKLFRAGPAASNALPKLLPPIPLRKQKRPQIEAEALEHAALAEVLKQRRAGRFISGDKMDERIAAMLARKRQAHAAQD